MATGDGEYDNSLPSSIEVPNHIVRVNVDPISTPINQRRSERNCGGRIDYKNTCRRPAAAKKGGKCGLTPFSINGIEKLPNKTCTSLLNGDINPFIRLLGSFLKSRSKMSLMSANEPVLQAIVEALLPVKRRVPELLLVMDGMKKKGSGRFGMADVFVLSDGGGKATILELKYVALSGLMKAKGLFTFGANDLEVLDKDLEEKGRESVLDLKYTYWSKALNKNITTTVRDILTGAESQARAYMGAVEKGWVTASKNSGVCDRRVDVTNSRGRLNGFVVVVIGFRQILWKQVGEQTTKYRFRKIG